ncbi:MAG TPA: GvpL/GvpF family gas vesicle protein [Bacillota bacterium]|nr:GvpL/GvpF family gas vesicle protein [Bacillota bacterium]
MVYLYCITDAKKQDLTGLDAGLVKYDPFTVVAGEPGAFDPTSPLSIMKHFEVNDRILRRGFAVLPFAYGTVVPAGEIDSFIKDKYDSIMLNLALLRGKVEMGIKVLVFVRKDRTGDLLKRFNDSPGHRYLSQRVKKYAPFVVSGNTVKMLLDDLNKYLGPYCSGVKTKMHSQKNILINSAFLVEAGLLPDFIKTCEELKMSYPECRFLISGPWPPYNFINMGENQPGKRGDSLWNL